MPSEGPTTYSLEAADGSWRLDRRCAALTASSGLDVTVRPQVPLLPESAGEALGAGPGRLQLQRGLFLGTCVLKSYSHSQNVPLLLPLAWFGDGLVYYRAQQAGGR